MHAIVMGASAGGVDALLQIASKLPPTLDAVVGVVLHVGSHRSILPQLLSARGPMRARHPDDGEPLKRGTILVAPPDLHMTFTKDSVRLSRAPRENFARPAIDPLFRSAALAWRECAIGVVLSGTLDDGSAGLAAIKQCGGTAIVQDPATALERDMPASALRSVAVDHCLPPGQIAGTLTQLAGRRHSAPRQPPPDAVRREQLLFEGQDFMNNLSAVGKPSSLTCPECGGSLWEINGSEPLRYRCHTGHAFSAGSLEKAQVERAEDALWSTVRALQEREMLLRRLAMVADATGDASQAQAGQLEADRVHSRAELLKGLARGEVGSA